MVKIEIPVTFGTGLVFVGIIVLGASIFATLAFAPMLGWSVTAPESSLIITQYLMSWLFVISGFVLVFMGIRRIRPA